MISSSEAHRIFKWIALTLAATLFFGCQKETEMPRVPSLSVSLSKDSFLLGEPITVRVSLENAWMLPGEPWLFEGVSLIIWVEDEAGNVPISDSKVFDVPIPAWDALSVSPGETLLLEKEIVIGDISTIPQSVRTLVLEDRIVTAQEPALRAKPLLREGRNTLHVRNDLMNTKSRTVFGSPSLVSSVSFTIVAAPKHEQAASALMSARSSGSDASNRAVLTSLRNLYKTYPDSTFAPWARYYATKLLVGMGHLDEAQRLLAELASSKAKHWLPSYQIAYLLTEVQLSIGEKPLALRKLTDELPQNTRIILDSAKTGQQKEGWRLLNLKTRLKGEKK